MASTTISKKKVAEAAAKAKAEHGWCDEIDAMLREIGIEPIKEPTVVVTLEIPLHLLLQISCDATFADFMNDGINSEYARVGYALSVAQNLENRGDNATFTLKEYS